MQVTVHHENQEIFMEFAVPVVQKPVRFITHVSRIDTGEPRTSGPIAFVFNRGAGAEQRVESPQPARTGIYLPEFSFPEAGQWDLRIEVGAGAEMVSVPMPAIEVFASEQQRDEAPHAEAPEGISFLKEQQWKLLTQMRPAEMRTMTERIPVSATVKAKAGNRTIIRFPAAGILMRGERGYFPEVGQRVTAGQRLALLQAQLAGADRFTAESARAQLYADIARAQSRLVEERAAMQQAERNYVRTTKLYEQKAKSEREMEEARFGLTTARANLDAAEKVMASIEETRKRLDAALGTNQQQDAPVLAIVAPNGGVVTEVKRTPGEGGESGDHLFTILDADTVLLEAQIRPEFIDRAPLMLPASYRLPGGETGSILDRGKLVFRGIELDPLTKRLPVVYEMPNPNGEFVIGSLITLELASTSTFESLAIPADAIIEEDGQPVAYVQISGETFERRVLAIGLRDEDYVQVLEGLAAGEWVVTQGAYAVRLAAVSTNEIGHGHTH